MYRWLSGSTNAENVGRVCAQSVVSTAINPFSDINFELMIVCIVALLTNFGAPLTIIYNVPPHRTTPTFLEKLAFQLSLKYIFLMQFK